MSSGRDRDSAHADTRPHAATANFTPPHTPATPPNPATAQAAPSGKRPSPAIAGSTPSVTANPPTANRATARWTPRLATSPSRSVTAGADFMDVNSAETAVLRF